MVPESCTGKRLKVLWLPASLFLGRGRVNPLFPLVFSPLSPQPPAPGIKLIREKPQNFLLLPSGPKLLSSERNPPNPCFGPGPGLRDGHLAAPHPAELGVVPEASQKPAPRPHCPLPGHRHRVLQPEAPGLTFSCSMRAAGADIGSAGGTQPPSHKSAQITCFLHAPCPQVPQITGVTRARSRRGARARQDPPGFNTGGILLLVKPQDLTPKAHPCLQGPSWCESTQCARLSPAHWCDSELSPAPLIGVSH